MTFNNTDVTRFGEKIAPLRSRPPAKNASRTHSPEPLSHWSANVRANCLLFIIQQNEQNSHFFVQKYSAPLLFFCRGARTCMNICFNFFTAHFEFLKKLKTWPKFLIISSRFPLARRFQQFITPLSDCTKHAPSNSILFKSWSESQFFTLRQWSSKDFHNPLFLGIFWLMSRQSFRQRVIGRWRVRICCSRGSKFLSWFCFQASGSFQTFSNHVLVWCPSMRVGDIRVFKKCCLTCCLCQCLVSRVCRSWHASIHPWLIPISIAMCSWNFYVITSSMSCQLFLRVKLITWSRLFSDPRHWRGIPPKNLTVCFSFSGGTQFFFSDVIFSSILQTLSTSVRMLCARLTTFTRFSHISTGYVHLPLNFWRKRRRLCRCRQNWNSMGIWPGNQWLVQPRSLQRIFQIRRKSPHFSIVRRQDDHFLVISWNCWRLPFYVQSKPSTPQTAISAPHTRQEWRVTPNENATISLSVLSLSPFCLLMPFEPCHEVCTMSRNFHLFHGILCRSIWAPVFDRRFKEIESPLECKRIATFWPIFCLLRLVAC